MWILAGKVSEYYKIRQKYVATKYILGILYAQEIYECMVLDHKDFVSFTSKHQAMAFVNANSPIFVRLLCAYDKKKKRAQLMFKYGKTGTYMKQKDAKKCDLAVYVKAC